MKSIALLIAAILLISVTFVAAQPAPRGQGGQGRPNAQGGAGTQGNNSQQQSSSQNTNSNNTSTVQSLLEGSQNTQTQQNSQPPQGPPSPSEIISNFSTEEKTYFDWISAFLVTSTGASSEAAHAMALEYMHYYQMNSSVSPTDSSTCGTSVPQHVSSTSP